MLLHMWVRKDRGINLELLYLQMGFPHRQLVNNLPAVQETWVWFLGQKIPWRRKWQSTPVFLPGESHGQRSLSGYSPWRCKGWTQVSDGTTTTHLQNIFGIWLLVTNLIATTWIRISLISCGVTEMVLQMSHCFRTCFWVVYCQHRAILLKRCLFCPSRISQLLQRPKGDLKNHGSSTLTPIHFAPAVGNLHGIAHEHLLSSRFFCLWSLPGGFLSGHRHKQLILFLQVLTQKLFS